MSRPTSGGKSSKKTTPSTAQRPTKSAYKAHPKTSKIWIVTIGGKNDVKTESKSTARDNFIKKVQICMSTYNYADETTDVKGKVRIQR